MAQGRPYHAGGDAAGTSADHHVGDLVAPELLAFGVGQEGQGRLLELVRGLVGCRETGWGQGFSSHQLTWVPEARSSLEAVTPCGVLILYHHNVKDRKLSAFP